ncbi:GFA family protein [Vibrio maerlii]|uniref:GFA family protein n=1 Tax=Vibrio maerlii TaxID=2231648 RepID=UPI000E3BA5CB|nr:GFA family protein [Vibrio maerlii]
MNKVRTAECKCHKVALVCQGEPLRTAVCHCFECQKRTGSIFGVQARFAKEQVSLNGETTQFTRIADSGHQVTYSFCPCCGTTMLMQLSAAPDALVVPVGLFKESDFPIPSFSIYEENKQGWVTFDCQIESYA